MTKISVYYEDHLGLDEIVLVPTKMIIRIPRGRLDWNKRSIHFPISAPFNRHFIADYRDDVMSVSILIDELIISHDHPNHFGISLDNLVKRLEKMKERENLVFDYIDIEQFIIQIDDLEELLQMDVRSFYELRGK